MKKTLCALMASVMALSLLAGCGSDSGKDAASASPAASAKPAVTKKDDLANARIAVQESTTGDIYVTDEYPDAKISRFKSALDAGMDLKNGKVDAFVIDELPAKTIVEKNPSLKILDEEFTKEEYAIAMKKGNTELVNKVNDILAAMKADGRFETITKAFIEKDEEALAKLKALPEPTGSETLIMGTNASFPPFEYRDDSGEVAGFDVEMAKEIARVLGMSFKVEDMNFDSLPAAVSSGKITMAVAGMTVTDERKENVDFSDGYYTSTQVIMVQK